MLCACQNLLGTDWAETNVAQQKLAAAKIKMLNHREAWLARITGLSRRVFMANDCRCFVPDDSLDSRRRWLDLISTLA
jgi:hypothetical protein